MAPRRSGRRNVSPYKKGEYIEYQYKGQTVTGKLLKKSPSDKSVWIVTPTDRRRKNEDIPEKALGKVINAQEAMNNRGPKLKKTNVRESLASGASNSDGSVDVPQAAAAAGGVGVGVVGVGVGVGQKSKTNGRSGSPNEDSNSKAGSKKRKSDDSNIITSSSSNNKSHQHHQNKAVTFSQESRKRMKKAKKAKAVSTRIGTRSTRGSGEAVLLPELPTKRKFKQKKVKMDENVTVVKMLTGILYLYRGDRPRAEFIRNK
jgi:hypothetical protein